MSKEIATGGIAALMSAHVNIGIDEVVSVFVSQYESNLFARKDELSANLKVLKKELADQEKHLLESVDRAEYEHSIPALNVHTHVTDVRINWKSQHQKKDELTICVKVQDGADRSERYASNYTKQLVVAISAEQVAYRDERNASVETLNAELLEVMSAIKAVSRKEREIRGKIAAMKLKESGFEELLQSEDMLKLVQL